MTFYLFLQQKTETRSTAANVANLGFMLSYINGINILLNLRDVYVCVYVCVCVCVCVYYYCILVRAKCPHKCIRIREIHIFQVLTREMVVKFKCDLWS